MKKLLSLLTLFCLSFSLIIAAPIANKAMKIAKEEGVQPELLTNFSVEAFTTMTPKNMGEYLGRKPKLKEVIALKAAQKKIKKAAKKNDADAPKKQLVAFLLALFLGGLGIHRFYLGYTGIGIAQLLTGGGCGIWALIDIIRIATGDMTTKDGSALESW